jgi:hypothetical protein
LAGEVPRQGVVVEGVNGVKLTPIPAEIHKNGAKNKRFSSIIVLKIVENAIFYAKVLNKIFQNVFEEYMTFKMFCYLRQYGVIPVQSFGSHIRPQPSGLGLIITLTQSRRLYSGRENINLKIAEIRHYFRMCWLYTLSLLSTCQSNIFRSNNG